MDKIIENKNTYAKKLPYVGRHQVVLAVLFFVHSFWGSVFILPQSIVKEVVQKCRSYIWGRSEDKKHRALVSWDKVHVYKMQ